MSDLMKNLESALRLGNDAYCFVDRLLLEGCQAKIADQAYTIEQLKAKIDALMLEYCPEEMTKEQMENWENHQKAIQ